MDTILQQITDLWADFLAKTQQKIIENGGTFDEITKDTWDFLCLVGTLTVSGMLQEVEKELHEQVKATHQYHVIDKNRKRTMDT